MPEQSGADALSAPSLLSARFELIVVAGFGYFISFAMLLPTPPRYIVNELDGDDFQVGLVMGSFGIAAAVVGPFVAVRRRATSRPRCIWRQPSSPAS